MAPWTDVDLLRFCHELRGPLTIIHGYTSLLVADRPLTDVERREFLVEINRAVDKAHGMISVVEVGARSRGAEF